MTLEGMRPAMLKHLAPCLLLPLCVVEVPFAALTTHGANSQTTSKMLAVQIEDTLLRGRNSQRTRLAALLWPGLHLTLRHTLE